MSKKNKAKNRQKSRSNHLQKKQRNANKKIYQNNKRKKYAYLDAKHQQDSEKHQEQYWQDWYFKKHFTYQSNFVYCIIMATSYSLLMFNFAISFFIMIEYESFRSIVFCVLCACISILFSTYNLPEALKKWSYHLKLRKKGYVYIKKGKLKLIINGVSNDINLNDVKTYYDKIIDGRYNGDLMSNTVYIKITMKNNVKHILSHRDMIGSSISYEQNRKDMRTIVYNIRKALPDSFQYEIIKHISDYKLFWPLTYSISTLTILVSIYLAIQYGDIYIFVAFIFIPMCVLFIIVGFFAPSEPDRHPNNCNPNNCIWKNTD